MCHEIPSLCFQIVLAYDATCSIAKAVFVCKFVSRRVHPLWFGAVLPDSTMFSFFIRYSMLAPHQINTAVAACTPARMHGAAKITVFVHHEEVGHRTCQGRACINGGHVVVTIYSICTIHVILAAHLIFLI